MRTTHSLRASASAVSLATAIMVLASTQPQSFATPDFDLASLIIHGTTSNPTGDAIADIFDGELKHTADGGFLYANYLGGPVGIYGALHSSTAQTEVLSVADGPDDTTQLKSLLDSTRPARDIHGAADRTDATAPYHVGSEFYSTAQTYVLNIFADVNAMTTHITQQATHPDAKPAIDEHGTVDCAGATSCQTDPNTNVTTVIYPDGIIALVKQVNDLTLVAYKTAGSSLGHLDTLRQPADGSVPEATPSPAPAANPSPVTEAPATDPVAVTPSTAPAVAPRSVKRGPLLNVVRPAPDYTPGRSGSSTTIPTFPNTPGNLATTVDAVTGAVKSVLNAVTDTVKNVLNLPGSAGDTDTGTAGGTGATPSTP